MPDNILLSPKEAENLNELVQKRFGSHLFLFCNYNPDSIRVFGKDAIFQVYINNLYKLMNDASICKNLSFIADNHHLYMTDEFGEWKKIEDYISCFRTALDHNFSAESANLENITRLNNWIRSKAGKDPESAEDYTKPVAALEEFGNRCIKIIRTFLDKANMSPEREEIGKELEQQVLKYYKKPTNLNLIDGQLKSLYLAYTRSSTMNLRDLGSWIENSLMQEYADMKNRLLCRFPIPGHPGITLDEVDDMIDQKRAEIIRTVAEHPAVLRPKHYKEYVEIMVLRDLENTVNGRSFTECLLPQDFVQNSIVKLLKLPV